MMGALAPRELLVDLLQKEIDAFKEAQVLGKSEKEQIKQFQKIAPPCILIISKIASEERGPFEMMEDIEKLTKARDLLDMKES
jgi:hypothetical protein